MDASLVARMKEHEQGNPQLKRMYAGVQRKNEAVMTALPKSAEAFSRRQDVQKSFEGHGAQHSLSLRGIQAEPDRLQV